VGHINVYDTGKLEDYRNLGRRRAMPSNVAMPHSKQRLLQSFLPFFHVANSGFASAALMALDE
jgi:hypothetical protein